jgi:biotin carboxyl carrier protein
VVPYLTLVGELAAEAQSIDFDYAFQRIATRARATAANVGDAAVARTREALDLKETLLKRPITMLVEEPHFLSAWLSQHRLDSSIEENRVVWKRNPVEIVAETYHCLQMDDRPGEPAAHRIWDHDQQLLETALGFYRKLMARVGEPTSWPELDQHLRSEPPAFGFTPEMWQRVRAAHSGHQMGLEILAFLPLIAAKVGFYDLDLNDDLTITIPERLLDSKHQDTMRKILVPPPATKSDEIVAAMGGTFYTQEAPHLPPFVSAGSHFKQGDPLYIIEVMKMFNKVYAAFSGSINELLVKESGVVVRKGQPLFRITPDEVILEEDPQERTRRIESCTEAYLEKLL